MPMTQEQLDAVRDLLTASRVLSLALVVDDEPVIGLLPFAVTPDYRAIVVHASRLARHARGLQGGAPFDALLHEPVVAGVDALQVRRLTLRGTVHAPEPGSPAYDAVRQVYLGKLPEAEAITELGDFAFFVLLIDAGRLVTGFGAAANVTSETLTALGHNDA
jgi:putative heme iron utilization protein